MNCCKLVWRIDELLPDFGCKLGDGDEVSYTTAKAHRGLECSAVIASREEKLPHQTYYRREPCQAIVVESGRRQPRQTCLQGSPA